jgi:hypothetical protein
MRTSDRQVAADRSSTETASSPRMELLKCATRPTTGRPLPRGLQRWFASARV